MGVLCFGAVGSSTRLHPNLGYPIERGCLRVFAADTCAINFGPYRTLPGEPAQQRLCGVAGETNSRHAFTLQHISGTKGGNEHAGVSTKITEFQRFSNPRGKVGEPP